MARKQRVPHGARQARTGVWYEHTLVGTLVKAADSGIGFSSAPAWPASEDALPVASVPPLVQGAQRGDLVLAAFDNLLPDAEGKLRAKIAERVAAPDRDVFSLLSVLGRDCAGALQFLPQGEISVDAEISALGRPGHSPVPRAAARMPARRKGLGSVFRCRRRSRSSLVSRFHSEMSDRVSVCG